jgi:hypothetical protein
METNIHDLTGIRTHDPNNQAVADLSLKPSSHRDRLTFRYKDKVVDVVQGNIPAYTENHTKSIYM